ncbi:hypothetical protein RUND412_000168 [Rhizina undulata]
MKFTTATIIAAAAFLPTISAHLSPLKPDGSDFPCHGSAPEAPVTEYEPGSMQALKLKGVAVHGGGSGQMSITYETKPNKNTKFRVMTSFEGNHPMATQAGNLGNAELIPPIKFKVPAGLPAGKAVDLELGNREMYMQCATVTINGLETSKAAFNALPEMFRANSGNGCAVPEGVVAIKFKNSGPYIVGSGKTTIGCDKIKSGSGSGSRSSRRSNRKRLSRIPPGFTGIEDPQVN